MTSIQMMQVGAVCVWLGWYLLVLRDQFGVVVELVQVKHTQALALARAAVPGGRP